MHVYPDSRSEPKNLYDAIVEKRSLGAVQQSFAVENVR